MMKKGDTVYGFQDASPCLYPILKAFAKENRRHLTPCESLLWNYLRRTSSCGYHFRRQHIIGDYIVDFACVEKKLVIEIDGAYHAEPRQAADDSLRSEWLEQRGYEVIRFSNKQVLQEIENVLREIDNRIKKQINSLHFLLPPLGEGRGGANIRLWLIIIQTIQRSRST